MSKETGGSAFPVTPQGNGGPLDNGMTLREYFAAKAMAAILSNTDYMTEIAEAVGNQTPEAIAKIAYSQADAMIEERNR